MIDTDYVNQRVKQFDEKHGSDYLRVGVWLIYSDGAYREVNPLGLLAEPPADAYERCKLQVQYREEALRQTAAAFKELKEVLTRQTEEAVRWANSNAPPAPPKPEDLQRLRALRGKVAMRQVELNEARQALLDARPLHVKLREQAAQVALPKIEAVRTELASIKI
jgi:hypothetical protein